MQRHLAVSSGDFAGWFYPSKLPDRGLGKGGKGQTCVCGGGSGEDLGVKLEAREAHAGSLIPRSSTQFWEERGGARAGVELSGLWC